MTAPIPGAALRAALAAHGLTQRALARQLGVGAEVVNRWCRGRRIPQSDDLMRLEEIFRCRAAELFPERSST